MTAPAASPDAVTLVTVPERRVYVRVARSRPGDIEAMGTVIAHGMLGIAIMALVIRLDGGAELTCPPHWATPARDLANLLQLPQQPGRAA